MKNQLMTYKGGGYDGCFWEWNYCFWDGDGKWHDIYSSGYSGIKNKEDAETVFEKKEYRDVYDYTVYNEMQAFGNAYNEGMVVGVVNEINKILDESIAFWECDTCKALCRDVEDGFLTGMQGCGGIAIQYSRKLCSDCYFLEEQEAEMDDD